MLLGVHLECAINHRLAHTRPPARSLRSLALALTPATEVVTPPLGDIVLPGVTRDSALALMRDHASGKSQVPGWPEKMEVNERKLVMADLVEAEKNGTLVEVFGTGTAAVVSAVDKIGYAGRDIEIPCGPEGQGMGDIAKGLLDRIDAIQTGKFEHEWSVRAE